MIVSLTSVVVVIVQVANLDPMPLIEVLEDDGSDQETSYATLEELLKVLDLSLRVPKDFKDLGWRARSEAATLLAWRDASNASLKRIYLAIQEEDQVTLDRFFLLLIDLVVPFTGSGDWVKPEARKCAQGVLKSTRALIIIP